MPFAPAFILSIAVAPFRTIAAAGRQPWLILMAAAVFLLAAGGRERSLAAPAVHRVWSAPAGGGLGIFYSGPAAAGSLRVTGGPEDDITPTLSRDGQGRLHVFWIRQDDRGSRLFTSSLTDGAWRPPQALPVGQKKTSHPTAVLDGSGVLHLAWVGFDGIDDDIYASTLNEGTWSPPRRVGGNDRVPDLYPVLGLDGAGMPWLYWLGFDGRGYSGYGSRWSGSAWSAEQRADREDAYRAIILDELRALETESSQAAGEQGVAFLREGEAVPFLPLRLKEVLR